MKNVEIINITKPLTASLRAGYCQSFFCRLKGLTFRRDLPDDWGLLLVESNAGRLQTAIHMLFVFFPLGIVWINEAGEVVDERFARSWLSFIIPSRPAKYVLEIAPERLKEFQIGDVIRFEEVIN